MRIAQTIIWRLKFCKPYCLAKPQALTDSFHSNGAQHMLDVEAIQCILLACTDGPNQNLLLAEISFVLLIKCVFAIDPYEHIESTPPRQTVSHKHPQICFREQPLQELRTPHVDICGCTFTFYFYFWFPSFVGKKQKKAIIITL